MCYWVLGMEYLVDMEYLVEAGNVKPLLPTHCFQILVPQLKMDDQLDGGGEQGRNKQKRYKLTGGSNRPFRCLDSGAC